MEKSEVVAPALGILCAMGTYKFGMNTVNEPNLFVKGLCGLGTFWSLEGTVYCALYKAYLLYYKKELLEEEKNRKERKIAR